MQATVARENKTPSSTSTDYALLNVSFDIAISSLQNNASSSLGLTSDS
jgi:hypothetical protein